MISPACRNVLIGFALVAAGLGSQMSPPMKEMRRRGQAAWSAYKLANIGHAALVYAADHDDTVPHSPGNYAFSVAYARDKSCASLDPTLGQACHPANVDLQGYGADYASFRSPADEPKVPGEKSFYDLTTTPVAQGASFEYWWTPELTKSPVSEQKEARKTPVFVSLFSVPGDSGEDYQVCYLDGHVGTLKRAQLEGH